MTADEQVQAAELSNAADVLPRRFCRCVCDVRRNDRIEVAWPKVCKLQAWFQSTQ